MENSSENKLYLTEKDLTTATFTSAYQRSFGKQLASLSTTPVHLTEQEQTSKDILNLLKYLKFPKMYKLRYRSDSSQKILPKFLKNSFPSKIQILWVEHYKHNPRSLKPLLPSLTQKSQKS